MKETAFEKICGSCDGIDVNDITEDDIRAQANVWADQGEPCTDDEIEAAIEYLNDMKK